MTARSLAAPVETISRRSRPAGHVMPELFGFGQRRLQGLGARIAGLAIGLIAFNLLIWAWTFAAFREHPLLLGTALLAYAFGLRHAVDADHIAAIDNVTRKLIQGSKRPISVGLFFSLGHSTLSS
jgi:nickel/cobalt transporter (NiCoT) family protein